MVKDATPQQATERVREAVERGVNYFDVAPTYGDAEEKLGPALAPFRRNVFLACKTTQRRKAKATSASGEAGAAVELERSLKRLRTDHVDLYQLHAVTTLEEVETICGPGGALEAFQEAKQAGKLRFTLSHPVAAAIPPGDESLFRMALDLATPFTPLTTAEAEALKQKALQGEPIFRFPHPA